jgi:26 proteasome complex subunit DSS1
MPAAPTSGAAPASKTAPPSDKSAPPSKDGKPAAALEEDDEFEDFPVESMLTLSRSRLVALEGGSCPERRLLTDRVMADWTQEDTEVPGDNTHLWEESWDDDDTSEDFSAQLK